MLFLMTQTWSVELDLLAILVRMIFYEQWENGLNWKAKFYKVLTPFVENEYRFVKILAKSVVVFIEHEEKTKSNRFLR